MKKILALTLVCTLFASGAYANSVTLCGKNFSYDLPSGYNLVDELSDPAIQELAAEIAGDESMEFVLLENKGTDVDTSMGEPLFVMFGVSPEMVEFSRMEFEFLVAIMNMALNMGESMDDGFVVGEVVQGQAGKMSDTVILYDEADSDYYSFAFRAQDENEQPLNEYCLMSFVFSDSVFSVIQLGNAENVEQYNAFIRKAAENLRALQVKPVRGSGNSK